MKKPMLLAVDGASFMWRGLLATKDTENGYEQDLGDGQKKWINSAIHGFDNVQYYLLDVMKTYNVRPIDVILVLEGKNSKQPRLQIANTYKSKDKKASGQYEQFELLRTMLREWILELGGQVVTQDRAEGDDVLAWLAQNTEVDLTVATYDNDLTALNGRNDYGANVEVWINGLRGVNKYGGFDVHLVTTYKALVGDSSDNIKGCHGFGEVSFMDLAGEYGWDGVEELHSMLLKNDLSPLAELAEDRKANPLLGKIWDQGREVIESFNLAKLRPEWVDTMNTPVKWEAGMVRQRREEDRDPRFKHWYGQQWLVTGDSFDKAVAWAWPKLNQSPAIALDIETSGSDESDEWLARLSRTGDEDDAGVDVFGHTLTGLSLTFGDNNQYSMYFSVDHADTDNCESEKLRQLVDAIGKLGIPIIIHNMSFELTVLFNEWGAKQLDNGFHGFIPNVIDTMLSCAYTDENSPRGLKYRSKTVLGYEQMTYRDTTEATGDEGTLPPGGKMIGLTGASYVTQQVGTGQYEPVFDDVTGDYLGEGAEVMRTEYVLDDAGEKIVKTPPQETRRYRMNELSGAHVTAYGCDDTITTIAHHNHNRIRCQLEHHWQTYLTVEIDAAYQHAKNFIDGIKISLEKMRELEKDDGEVRADNWATLREYLIDNGWSGTRPPVYGQNIEASQIKEAFEIVFERKLDTQMRTPSKLVTFIREEAGETIFAGLLQQLLDGDATPFQRYVLSKFKGEPKFNLGSYKQKQRLLYEVMGFEVKVRNKPTDNMKENGEPGSPKSDNLAIAYALQTADPRQTEVLHALRLMGMVDTRQKLYYNKYPNFPHWKDGLVHSHHNQSSTNTRRASSSKPNMQQLPKHEKIDGYASRFREVIVPHRDDAVIVSIDFKAQELRLIAEYSRDPVMLSMYIGDDLRDQHSLTGLAIAQRRDPQHGWTYEEFEAVRADKKHVHFPFVKESRNLGKKLNFTAEYGAMAEKVATTLLITVEEAQEYLDAREEMFVEVGVWKASVIDEAIRTGKVRTRMGAVRHLRDAIMSDDRSKSSKAERQAVNYEIQGSSGEQTKMAEGRMWRDNLFFDFDAVCYGPVHDEVVASVRICDLFEFIPRMHAAMVAPYGGMTVPIEGDISFGPSYGEQIEIGPRPSREAIQGGLDKVLKLKLKEAA